jgi:hypothetical protein
LGDFTFWPNEIIENLWSNYNEAEAKKEVIMAEKENKNSVLEVQWLADLVDYQDGSVVSREIPQIQVNGYINRKS